MLHTDPTDVVDDAARRGLPAVAGDEGVAVGVLAVVPQRRNLLLEVLALDHVGIAPSARGIQGVVGGFVVYQVDIVRRVVVDVMLGLHLLEDLVVVHGDVGDVGVGEGWTAATDATPRSATAVVDHHGFLASF